MAADSNEHASRLREMQRTLQGGGQSAWGPAYYQALEAGAYALERMQARGDALPPGAIEGLPIGGPQPAENRAGQTLGAVPAHGPVMSPASAQAHAPTPGAQTAEERDFHARVAAGATRDADDNEDEDGKSKHGKAARAR